MARFLRNTGLLKQILKGQGFHDKNDERERYYNIKMEVGVVSEICYGMLKSCLQILYKKAASKVFNLK